MASRARAPDPQVSETAEAACREQPAVGDLPLKVLDARGEGEVTIVFADDETAAVCFATATQAGAATATARPIAGYRTRSPSTPRSWASTTRRSSTPRWARGSWSSAGSATRSTTSAASFDDWTWGKASMAGGWYAIWWPGTQPALTVAASDARSIAIDA